jgi:tRNA A22 N-methylase
VIKIKDYKIIHIFPNGEKRQNIDGYVLECNEDTEHVFKFLYEKAVEIIKETIDKTA